MPSISTRCQYANSRGNHRAPLATGFTLVQAEETSKSRPVKTGVPAAVTNTVIDPAQYRQVLGSYPTGVVVVTALDEDSNPAAMVVGTFTSVSLDPPLVGFLPDKSSSSWPKIEQAGHFCVNVLGSDQQNICRQMAAKGPDKFASVEYSLSDHNLPVLSNSIASIECQLHSVTEAGDHWFVLGKVLRMIVNRDEDPMLFHRGRYGGFAEII